MDSDGKPFLCFTLLGGVWCVCVCVLGVGFAPCCDAGASLTAMAAVLAGVSLNTPWVIGKHYKFIKINITIRIFASRAANRCLQVL